jgi:8-oxo-dGTP diphosphatase
MRENSVRIRQGFWNKTEHNPDNRVGEHIIKIGLAVRDHECLLLVRKKGSTVYILPGGKPEEGENDIEALTREIKEELGCLMDLTNVKFLGSFSDTAAEATNKKVTVRLYSAPLIGEPKPQSEIECLKWYCPEKDLSAAVAPSLANHIIPFLFVGTSSDSVETTSR